MVDFRGNVGITVVRDFLIEYKGEKSCLKRKRIMTELTILKALI